MVDMRSNFYATILYLFCCLAGSRLVAQQPPVNPNDPGGSQINVISTPALSRSDFANLLSKGIRIAYLVGISDYDPDGTGFPRLKYPIKDVTELDKTLRQQGYTVVRIEDDEATASRIRGDLKNYAKELAGGDGEGSFLFYFSGHGYAVDGKNYLATYGTQAKALDHQGLAVSEVADLLDSINLRQLVAFIDACRDDPDKAKGIASIPQSIAAFKPLGRTAFLFSTKMGQVSREDKDYKQGVFTYYLLEGLNGRAAGSDGLISWNDLKQYVEDRMKERSLISGEFQIPYDTQGSPVDFVIARVHTNPVPASAVYVPQVHVPNQITRIADLGSSPVSAPSQPGLCVTSVSPNGQFAAFANGRTVAVRNVSDGSTVAELPGPSRPIRTLEFSPDSKLVAAGAEDQSLWLWEIATTTGWQLQDKGLKLVNAISFSADRQFLATAGTDRTVRIWNVEQRQVIARSTEPPGIAGIVFRPDPRTTTVAFFGNGALVHVWNWTEKQSASDIAASGRVRSLSFSPDGTLLAVGLVNGIIEISDVTKPGQPTVLAGHEAAVEFLAFSRDGKNLASTSLDRTFRSWNIQEAVETRSTETRPGMQVLSLTFAPDGRLLALALRAGNLELWEVPSP